LALGSVEEGLKWGLSWVDRGGHLLEYFDNIFFKSGKGLLFLIGGGRSPQEMEYGRDSQKGDFFKIGAPKR